jgi:hypothetical protein
MKLINNQSFLMETVDYWDGAFSSLGEPDFTSESYRQMLKDTVNCLFSDCCECMGFSPETGIGADQIIAFWVSWKALNELTDESQDMGLYDRRIK